MLFPLLWLFLCVLDWSVHIGEAYHLDDVQSLYMEDMIRVYCPPLSNTSQFLQCVDTTRRNVRSLKLGEFYNNKPRHVVAMQANLERVQYVIPSDGIASELSIASGVVDFHSKLSVLQDISDDKRVKTICEVGFLGGYSTLNFLASNPEASLFVFDGDAHEKYSKAVVNSILERYPDRIINFIAGDWKYSLRNFQAQFGHMTTCNLLYIDGRQDDESIQVILQHMLPIMDPTFNRIVLDNFEQPAIANMFYYLMNKINVGVQCPQLPAHQLHQLTDSDPRRGFELGASTTVSVSSGASGVANAEITSRSMRVSRKSCPYKLERIQVVQGSTFTPCVAMYADNSNNSLHMEFVFSLQNCRTDPIPELEPLEYPFNESLEMGIFSVTFPNNSS
jgi:predicted O-methyltransferase YrrM